MKNWSAPLWDLFSSKKQERSKSPSWKNLGTLRRTVSLDLSAQHVLSHFQQIQKGFLPPTQGAPNNKTWHYSEKILAGENIFHFCGHYYTFPNLRNRNTLILAPPPTSATKTTAAMSIITHNKKARQLCNPALMKPVSFRFVFCPYFHVITMYCQHGWNSVIFSLAGKAQIPNQSPICVSFSLGKAVPLFLVDEGTTNQKV